MRVYSIKTAAALTGLSKKEIKRILKDSGIITDSLAVKDSKSLVVELQEMKEYFIETTLLITEFGISVLKEIFNAREWRANHG